MSGATYKISSGGPIALAARGGFSTLSAWRDKSATSSAVIPHCAIAQCGMTIEFDGLVEYAPRETVN
jgi:hypothetical protein